MTSPLLNAGADPNEAGLGETALSVAVNEGYAEAAWLLLKAGAKPDLQFYYIAAGTTALMRAARADVVDEECIRMLFWAGANPNIQDEDGWTALMWASSSENAELAKLLLEYNANPNIRGAYGATALINAKSAEIMQLLLDAGAAPNIQVENGRTALIFAAKDNDAKRVQLLLQAGAKPNSQDAVGQTAPMRGVPQFGLPVFAAIAAACLCFLPLYRRVLMKKSLIFVVCACAALLRAAPCAAQDSDLDRELISATRNDDASRAREPLASGADPDVQNTNDRATALTWAAQEGYTEIARALLGAGADPDIQNNYGATALDYATQFGYTDIANMLRAAGAR